MKELFKNESQAQTMSSLEIAELTGKRHDNVARDIEKTLNDVGIDPLKFEEIYLDGYNRKQKGYRLDKNLTITLVSGYNPKMRYAIVQRWQELENQQHKIPQTYAQALTLAAQQAEQLEAQAPKVNFYDKVVDRSTLLNASQVAQKVGMSAIALNKHLTALGVYNKSVKRGKVFVQGFIDKGLGELKQTDLGYSQAMFTTRGEAWVIEKLTSEGVI